MKGRGAEEYLALAQQALGGQETDAALAYAAVGILAAMVAPPEPPPEPLMAVVGWDAEAVRAHLDRADEQLANVFKVADWHDRQAQKYTDLTDLLQHRRNDQARMERAEMAASIHRAAARRIREGDST